MGSMGVACWGLGTPTELCVGKSTPKNIFDLVLRLRLIVKVACNPQNPT